MVVKSRARTWRRVSQTTKQSLERSSMPITTPKELCVSMLSELRHGAERSRKIYEELGQAAQNPSIKEALDARELVSSQIMNRLDECFKLIGETGKGQSTVT